MTIPVISATGSPFDLGHQVGVKAKALVHESVALVCMSEPADDHRRKQLLDVTQILARQLPHYLDEASGLAAGAGITPSEALELSVSADLSGRLPGYCSLVAVTESAGPLLGKNIDTSRDMAAVQLIEQVHPSHGHSFVHVTCAGAMWTDGGVNQAGLGLVNASLSSSSVDPGGVPDGLLARELLMRCATVSEAIEMSAAHGVRTMGENMLLADAGGDTALIEKLPAGTHVRTSDSSAATNHVRSPDLIDAMDAYDPIAENSRARLDRLEAAVAERPPVSPYALFDILRDPTHGVFQDGTDNLWTIATIVVDVSRRSVWVCDEPDSKPVVHSTMPDGHE